MSQRESFAFGEFLLLREVLGEIGGYLDVDSER